MGARTEINPKETGFSLTLCFIVASLFIFFERENKLLYITTLQRKQRKNHMFFQEPLAAILFSFYQSYRGISWP